MAKFRDRFDHFLFHSWQLSPEIAGLIRILYCLYVFLFFIEHSPYMELGWIEGYPESFYRPAINLYFFMEGFPPRIWYLFLNCSILILNTLLFAGWRTKPTSIGLGVALLLLFSGFTDLGTIPQNSLLFIFPLVMAFSGWGEAFSYDHLKFPNRRKKADPILKNGSLTFLALILSLMFFFSGIIKIMGGWLDPEMPTTLFWILQVKELWVGEAVLAGPITALNLPLWLWEVFDYLILGFELSLLPLLFFPKLFRFWISLAIPFHLGILLFLGIDFSFHFLGYLVFVDWDNLGPRLRKWKERL